MNWSSVLKMPNEKLNKIEMSEYYVLGCGWMFVFAYMSLEPKGMFWYSVFLYFLLINGL